MGECWQEIFNKPIAEEIQKIIASGDKKLYGLWLTQVAHLTKHTSAHQAMVGTRIDEISIPYMKFCYEHALEEVGHEFMAINDLKKLGVNVKTVRDLPKPMAATENLTAFLYYAAERAHPATRLGFSYWAEKCYPFIQSLATTTKDALGLDDKQMTFFVSHSEIDEKHADDVEKVIQIVCESEADWEAVTTGMIETLNMAVKIFEEIYQVASVDGEGTAYKEILQVLS
jgi:hypothetical protein